MNAIAREIQAAHKCFRFHAQNSHPEKVAFYVGVGVVAVALVASTLGLVDYAALPEVVKTLINAFVFLVVYMFGRIHGKEVKLLKAETPK